MSKSASYFRGLQDARELMKVHGDSPGVLFNEAVQSMRKATTPEDREYWNGQVAYLEARVSEYLISVVGVSL